MPEKANLRGSLPLTLPHHPCPICGKAVFLLGVTEWGSDDHQISQAEYECETEPDIDSDEWWDWHDGHFSMPYVDWMPWENKMMEWLNRHYFYDDEA